MRIPLNRQSSNPLYQQIWSHLRHSILSGGFAPETRLPAVRELARDLGVNRITVETAYAELEAEGLIDKRVGSGTYVLPLAVPRVASGKTSDREWPIWQQELASLEGQSVLSPEAMLRAAGHPDPISFAGGFGDSRLYPAQDFRKVLQAALRRDGLEALTYGASNGLAALRGTIAHVLASQGLPVQPDNILITAGSQQALALIAQLLLKPGDVILTESPTYSLALDLFRALKLSIVGVPMDEEGMRIEGLETMLQRYHPKLIYTIPNFHNPTGSCMSGSRRRRLIVLADRYNVPVLEDDFVGDLRYDGRAQPALKSLDPGGGVIYVSTFSKMLMPGLRVGFVAADGPVYDRLVRFKRVNDLATSNLVQHALEAYVTVGRYQAHLRRSCQAYRKRRDAMTVAINRHLPADVVFRPPQGGLFVWLTLPEGFSAENLLPEACGEGVNFSPGKAFFPDGRDGDRCLRLNLAMQRPEEIEEGIRRLGAAMKRYAVSRVRDSKNSA